MMIQAKVLPALRRGGGGAGLGRFALVLGAAWALGALASTPAAALDTGWKGTCTFPVAPQAYNEMMRERVCLDQNYCQQMADRQGSAFTGNGCVMVGPSIAADRQSAPRSTYTNHKQ